MNRQSESVSHGARCCSFISFAIASLLILLLNLGFVSRAIASMKKTLIPRISVQEQYDDNIDLDPANYEDSDWITMVSPGFSLNLNSPRTQMALDYEAGFSFYGKDDSKRSTSHRGSARWGQALGRHLKLELNDSFVRSEDPILTSEGQIEEIFRERRVYYRNNGQVSLTWQFGPEGLLGLGYRNRYLDNRSSDYEDSTGHEFYTHLHTWVSPRFGFTLTSSINRGRFKQPEDFTGSPSEDFYDYNAGLSLRYRWQRSHYIYMSYSFLSKDFVPYFDPDTTDYLVHQSSLGIDLSISPHSHFNAEAGYFVQDYDDKGRKRDGTSFSASLSTRKEKGSLRIEGSGGFDQDYFSEENLGSSTFNQILGNANYQMTERFGIFASGSYRWEAFYGDDDIRERKDGVWRASGGISLSIWRWMNLLLDISHSERNSDVWSYEFEDNRIMLRLTGSYPIVL